MKQLNVYMTRDGLMHRDEHAARKQAENTYGLALTRLGHRLAQLTKYIEFTDFVDANLDVFIELKALKDDMELQDATQGE